MAYKEVVLTYTRTHLPTDKKSVHTYNSPYHYARAVRDLCKKIEEWNLKQPLTWYYEYGVKNEHLSKSGY